MKYPSLDLRRRMIEAYESRLCKTYEEVARTFGVGDATVSRNLRRKRETGDVLYKPRGHRRRVLDREWLARHASKYPDARLRDRAEAWERERGTRVSLQTVSAALREIGWSYKKRHRWHASATGKKTK